MHSARAPGNGLLYELCDDDPDGSSIATPDGCRVELSFCKSKKGFVYAKFEMIINTQKADQILSYEFLLSSALVHFSTSAF